MTEEEITKEIKNLTVTVTYTVELEEIEVSDKEYKALEKCYERGLTIKSYGDNDESAEDAYDWLSYNIKSQDAFDLNYEINDLEEEEQNESTNKRNTRNGRSRTKF
jgi:hypothetical protein